MLVCRGEMRLCVCVQQRCASVGLRVCVQQRCASVCLCVSV